jgi:hypothetical protein
VNYKVPGTFNGSNGIFELGINTETNTIYHFLFTEAVTKGKSFSAVNMVNKANAATRYVHPRTGQSVVIDLD